MSEAVKEIGYKDELLRKGIHLCSLSIPVIYYFISKQNALYILAGFLGFSLLIELLRFKSKAFAGFFYKVFGSLMRKHEVDSKKHNLNGATYVFMSAFFSILLFPKLFFLTAFPILIISDTVAALIGRKFGKHKFLAKSLEGTLAFFVSACIVVLFTPKSEYLYMEYLIGFIASGFAAIGENLSYGYADDNLVIPLTASAVMWVLYPLLLPGVSIFLKGVPY